ncbi:MAG TPA: hypothetical protein H9671_08865 [Firmicutes bacterium]|nr:hypothetical protein [Bacillota bacterium]
MAMLLVLGIGLLIGLRWFPASGLRWNTRIQLICAMLLVFCMGTALGSRPNLWQELQALGPKSLLFAVIPTLFSVLLVYGLTRKFPNGKR